MQKVFVKITTLLSEKGIPFTDETDIVVLKENIDMSFDTLFEHLKDAVENIKTTCVLEKVASVFVEEDESVVIITLTESKIDFVVSVV